MRRFTKTLASLALFALMLASAPAAHAAALTDAQVSAVISLLSSFGVASSTILQVENALGRIGSTPPPSSGTGSSTPSGGAGGGKPPPPTACPARDLSQGARGADVAALQAYLASTTGFSAGATGYFGPLTAAAVVKLQGANGVPQTGYVGPMTRAAIGCGPGPVSPPPQLQASLTASPSSGAAPLSVAFSASKLASAGPFVITFGDGANSGSTTATCLETVSASASTSARFAAPAYCQFSTSHTYQAAGTYNATLEGYIGCMWSNPHCDIATLPLATTSVTVQ